jgi:hypothetical protein
MHIFSSALAIVAGLSVLVSATPLNLTPTRTTQLEDRADLNPTPNAPGDPTNGWQALPAAPSAGIHATWKIGSAQFVSNQSVIISYIQSIEHPPQPLYQSSGRTKSEITRAVIILPGKVCSFCSQSVLTTKLMR